MPVLGPLVAYVQTPRNASGRLNEVMLETLIRNATEAGAHAVAVLGSVGGAAYMPRSMRKRVVATAVRATEQRIPVLAGIGALTTAEVALNLNEAAEVGASGALLQPMSYQPLLPYEVTNLYEQVNAITKLPLWVYNNPATTRHAFTLNELAHIAQLDNVAGFKDRAANTTELQHRIEHVSKAIGPTRAANFNWGFSGENKGALVLGSGGDTWHSALAGIMPSICVELADAAVEGRNNPDIAEFAVQMQRALNPLTVIMTQYGGIRVAHAVALQKGMDIGELPQPLRPLPAAIFGLVDLAMQSVEKSLRTLQEQLQRGGIAAAKNAVIQSGLSFVTANKPTEVQPTVTKPQEAAPETRVLAAVPVAGAGARAGRSTRAAQPAAEAPATRAARANQSGLNTGVQAPRHDEEKAVPPAPQMTRARMRELSAPTTRSAFEALTAEAHLGEGTQETRSSHSARSSRSAVSSHSAQTGETREVEIDLAQPLDGVLDTVEVGREREPKKVTRVGAYAAHRSRQSAQSAATSNEPQVSYSAAESSSKDESAAPGIRDGIQSSAFRRSSRRSVSQRKESAGSADSAGFTHVDPVHTADHDADATQVIHLDEENQVMSTLTGPIRVSAKARIQDETQRSDIARAAKNILLTGDPELDQTRVNLDRVVAPIVSEPARDSDNYVPKRARHTN